MILCNSNGAYFEFMYFQSEWLEFYTKNNINVVLWNYRGYGKSKGEISLDKAIEDGIEVLMHFKKSKELDTIGIHGESIGGCIAIEVASACGCNFLLADRTFGSLSNLIYFRYGALAYYLFKLSKLSNFDPALTFLNLSCYKVISSDPCDKIIIDVASLKTKVAASMALKANIDLKKYYSSKKWRTSPYIISQADFTFLENSINLIETTLKTLEKPEKPEIRTQILKTETYEEDSTLLSMQKLAKLLKKIDAGGMTFNQLLKSKTLSFSLHLWIMILETWGGCNNERMGFDVNSFGKNLSEANFIIAQFSSADSPNFFNSFKSITKILGKVCEYFQVSLENNAKSIRSNAEVQIENPFLKTGNFMKVSCGHGGQFSKVEQSEYFYHLVRSNFFQANLVI